MNLTEGGQGLGRMRELDLDISNFSGQLIVHFGEPEGVLLCTFAVIVLIFVHKMRCSKGQPWDTLKAVRVR